jgi:2-iminobutanoate/2-iminopropanoate deaminase
VTRRSLTSTKLLPPVGPFSHAVRSAGGDLFYVSGQAGLVKATGELVAGGTAAEAEQVLINIESVLEEAGLTTDDVIKVNIYLVDMADFAIVNEVYARHFRPPYPARTTISAAALPVGARVEMEVIARVPGQPSS